MGAIRTLDHRIKPPMWPVEPGLVDPAWRWASVHRIAMLPLWADGNKATVVDLAGTPFDVVNTGAGDGFTWSVSPLGTMVGRPLAGVDNFHFRRTGTPNYGTRAGFFTVMSWNYLESGSRTVVSHDAGGNEGWRFGPSGPSYTLQYTLGGVASYDFNIPSGGVQLDTYYAIGLAVTGNGGTARAWIKPLFQSAPTETASVTIGTMSGTPSILRFRMSGFDTLPLHGWSLCHYLWSAPLTEENFEQLARDPFGPFRPARRSVVFVTAAGVPSHAYTLTAQVA